MDMNAQIEADPANPSHSVLHGDAAVIVNGKFAQFGGRMMVQVSDMLLEQFVENFRQAAHALPAPADATPAAATVTPVETSATTAAPTQQASAPPAAPPKVAKEINGLAIVWMLIKNWFASLFGKKS